jgi:hypothetical protein
MIDERLNPNEIVERGKKLYEGTLRAKLEPHENGKYVAIDVNTGEYEVDRELIKARRRLEAKQPQSQTFVGRIGYPTAIKMGGAVRVTS